MNTYGSQLVAAYVICFLIFFGLLQPAGGSSTLLAQQQDNRNPLHFNIYQFTQYSPGNTPFWHHANRRGFIDPDASVSYLTGINLQIPVTPIGAGIGIGAGGELLNRFSDGPNTFHFPQLYLQAEYKALRLRAGRFYETMGKHIPGLSSGSMMLSPNATPFPKISLELSRFVDVPLTRGRVAFRGRYSEGILENDRFTKSPRVHQKSIYLKFRIERLRVFSGIIHNAMWGGESPQRGDLSGSFNDYLRIVFSQAASEESGMPGSGNRLGNSVGAYDFAATYTLDRIRFHAYRLFYLEDTPSTRFRSPWDGVWGAGFERPGGEKWINGLLYEFLHTITMDAKDHIPKGRANYYNHSVYQSGWSYYGNGLGNPLLTFDRDEGRFVNNMVIAHHIGLTGQPDERFRYRLLATYNRNYGQCDDRISPGRCGAITTENPMPDEWELLPRSEFRRDRYSALLEGQIRVRQTPEINFHGSVAFDFGDYQARRAGVLAGFDILF